MPEATQGLSVSGTVAAGSAGTMLTLSRRLDRHDTFLSGRLQIAGTERLLAVRILTFDDVTVLRLLDHPAVPPTGRWMGTLHPPHGWRTRSIPQDLLAAAICAHRDLGALDTAELRYALTFLGESSTRGIRQARIAAILQALPRLDQAS
jgi:hypothetical protein